MDQTPRSGMSPEDAEWLAGSSNHPVDVAPLGWSRAASPTSSDPWTRRADTHATQPTRITNFKPATPQRPCPNSTTSAALGRSASQTGQTAVVSRRRVGQLVGGVAAAGLGGFVGYRALGSAGASPNPLPKIGVGEPHAKCVAASALPLVPRLGSATLVYEPTAQPAAMRFDPGFLEQLTRWLADFNTTSRYGRPRQIWSYGAHVIKQECASWHAEGRAFDFSRLRVGDKVLVSCREDLWHTATATQQASLRRRYWTLAASLHLHFAYVLTHHFDAAHRNHIHVDNGISGSGMSRFDPDSRVQNQAVQAICAEIWGRPGEVTGSWAEARHHVAPVLDQLGVRDLTKQQTWQAFLRASVQRG